MDKTVDLTKNKSFDGWQMIVFWLAMFICTFYACTHMVAAGDTWVAMACGRHHSNHGVDTVEPFSANSHQAGPTEQQLEKFPEWTHGIIETFHPTGWINQNWGTHITFFSLAKWFSGDKEWDYNYNMLIFWKFAVNILAVIVVYYLGTVLGANRAVSAIAAGLALVIGRTFLDVRPAVYSNLLAPLLLLILALAVYKHIRYIWFIVPLAVFWGNVHGGYIYIFIMLIPFIGLHLLRILPKKWSLILYNLGAAALLILVLVKMNGESNQPFDEARASVLKFFSLLILLIFFELSLTIGRKYMVKIEPKKLYEVVAASAAALVAVIIFNPFHLTNLTHTFEISLSKHAESWRNVNEWHSAFERANPVGDEEPFIFMFYIAIAVFIIWLGCRFLKPKKESITQEALTKKGIDNWWLRIDLPLLTIAGLTVYMAVASRRFIPIAASAACPLIAFMIDSTARTVSARRTFSKRKLFQYQSLPKTAQYILTAATAVAIIIFGSFTLNKFYKVYIKPWPNDAKRDSIFMRMTASNLKPFDIGEFIRSNNLSGVVFNYWTEGGALAFFQEPDPKTGEVPLKLFMDGRAQAAYDHEKFILWTYIKSGGPVARNAIIARRKFTESDYKNIGEWINVQLKKHKAWVVIMPKTQVLGKRHNAFVRALLSTENWKTAYMDENQYMYVDTDTPKGKELFGKILSDKAVFPNQFSRNLTLGYNYLRSGSSSLVMKANQLLLDAFKESPNQAVMMELIRTTNIRNKRTETIDFIKLYVENMANGQGEYAKRAGKLSRLNAAILGSRFLAANVPGKKAYYQKISTKLTDQAKALLKDTIW